MNNTLDLNKLTYYFDDLRKTMDTLGGILQSVQQNKGEISQLDETQLSILSSLNLSTHDSNPQFVKFQEPKKNKNFLSMVATQLTHFTDKFSFKTENNTNWENLGYKVGISFKITANQISDKSKILFKQFKNDLKNQAKLLGIVIKENKITNNIHNFIGDLTLIGNKRIVKKMNRNFKDNLELIGFDAQELFQDIEKEKIDTEQVEKNISEKLDKKFNLKKFENNYQFTILNDLNNDNKLEMIGKIIWPQIAKELGQTMNLAISIYNLSKKNKDLKYLLDFSKKNNIHSDIIIHSLKNNPELLKDYPDSQKLLINKDSILKVSDKYETLIQNNLVILNSLVKATNVLKNELDSINNEKATALISKINTYPIAHKNGKENVIYTFDIIEKNTLKVVQEKKESKSVTP